MPICGFNDMDIFYLLCLPSLSVGLCNKWQPTTRDNEDVFLSWESNWVDPPIKIGHYYIFAAWNTLIEDQYSSGNTCAGTGIVVYIDIYTDIAPQKAPVNLITLLHILIPHILL